MTYARITGVGKYIPERHVSNTELEKIIDTSDAWIQENIGVKTRSVIDPAQTIAGMGIEAGREAVQKSGRGDIRLVICATNSPDVLYPATACRIAQGLELGHIPGYDLQAGCTGFLYALTQAKAVVESQNISVLVIGSDALSTGFLWRGDPGAGKRGVDDGVALPQAGQDVHRSGDRNAVLFGDGAGAVVLSPSEKPGLLATHIGAEYSDAISLATPFSAALNSPLYYLAGETERRTGGPGAGKRGVGGAHDVPLRADYYTKMNGRAIMKLSLTHVPKAIDTVLNDASLAKGDIDVFLPHQTNKHVIRKLAEHLNFPAEKIPDVLTQHGSLSTAVMPVSLHMALESGQLQPGNRVLMTAYGAGFTFGAAVMTW